jgi:hypothetical protein
LTEIARVEDIIRRLTLETVCCICAVYASLLTSSCYTFIILVITAHSNAFSTIQNSKVSSSVTGETVVETRITGVAIIPTGKTIFVGNLSVCSTWAGRVA